MLATIAVLLILAVVAVCGVILDANTRENIRDEAARRARLRAELDRRAEALESDQ